MRSSPAPPISRPRTRSKHSSSSSANNMEDPPRRQPTDDPRREDPGLLDLVPDNPNQPYDMREVVKRVVDDGEFTEVLQAHAESIVVGFARLNGRPVGVVGNQPLHLAGVLDINASVK